MKIRTFKQFLKLLERVPVNWQIVNLSNTLIRTTLIARERTPLDSPVVLMKACPICAVANDKIGVNIFSSQASEACGAAGIEMSDAMFARIVATADGFGTKADTVLMRAACGLR